MLSVGWEGLWASAESVLLLGAHSDDIEIGCGATILALLERRPDVHIDWIVFTASGERAREARESADRFLNRAKSKNVAVEEFRERYFPYDGALLKEYFDDLGRSLNPGVVFTHRTADAHQDHRLVGELTANTFRNHVVLEYEIPKYDADLGNPNVFVPVNGPTAREKIDIITKTFRTQQSRQWFSEETLLSMLRIRGIESKAPGGYAEGFHCRKLLLA